MVTAVDQVIQHETPPPPGATSLGAGIRAQRLLRGMRLVDLARTTGRSVGWLSQVERGLSRPSAHDLAVLAEALGVPLNDLIQGSPPAGEAGLIRRAPPEGQPLAVARHPALVEEVLTPGPAEEVALVRVTVAPGMMMTKAVRRDRLDTAHVLSGRLDLCINGEKFEIGPGDSFQARAQPLAWMNPYEEPCLLIWAVSPPGPVAAPEEG